MTQRMTHAEALAEARNIVARMTLDEKIGQLNYTAPAIERLGIPEYNYWIVSSYTKAAPMVAP